MIVLMYVNCYVDETERKENQKSEFDSIVGLVNPGG